MYKATFIIFLAMSVFGFSQSSIEVEGSLILGNSDSCEIGSIRWNGEIFQGYNGVTWIKLGANVKNQVKDIDGNIYKTVRIGRQEWMAENLRVQHFSDGTSIDNDVEREDWAANFGPKSPAYCWYDNDSTTYHSTRGILYNGWTIDTIYNSGKNVCPAGWETPSIDDFEELRLFLGGFEDPYTSDLGECLKSANVIFWNQQNTVPSNSTGFSGIGSGVRGQVTFSFLGDRVNYWSKTRNSASALETTILVDHDDRFTNSAIPFNTGASVRCLKYH